jgi:hypothetical protein
MPNYVEAGRVRCDFCDSGKVRNGYHAKPKRDFCLDCMMLLKDDAVRFAPADCEKLINLNINPYNRQSGLADYVLFTRENIDRISVLPLPPFTGLESLIILLDALANENCKVEDLW